MKKYLIIPFLSGLISLSSLFTGCVKDTCHKTNAYTYYIPVYKTKDQVKANIKSNPAREIQNPGKIFILGNYIFLNEIDKGVHIINNANPASPENVAFVDIPGNMDMAVKGNILYADSYTDLITLDITDPLKVVVKKYDAGIFPYRSYANGFVPSGSQIIVDWIKRDTVVSEACEGNPVIFQDPSVLFTSQLPSSSSGSSNSSNSSPLGLGGSMARFALVGDRLYTVSDMDLNVFNIANPSDPTFASKVLVDWHVETIYPFKNNLFIGSNNGMFIYNVQSSPDNPAKIGEFTHARACDPVIADDSFAFVTLHSGTDCLGFNNELDVVRLNNLVDATLATTYSLISPHGLSKDGDLLFVCDGSAGLKVYNASDPVALQVIKEIPGFETYDVIAYNKIALVVAKDGLYEYDYSDVNNIHLISKTGFF